jgi:hypothetical protein
MKELFWLRNEFLMELMMKRRFWMEQMDSKMVLLVRREGERGVE